jgi:hypothetical protein
MPLRSADNNEYLELIWQSSVLADQLCLLLESSWDNND